MLILDALSWLASPFTKYTCSSVTIKVKAGWARMKEEAPDRVRDLRMKHVVSSGGGKRNYGALVEVTPLQFAMKSSVMSTMFVMSSMSESPFGCVLNCGVDFCEC